jgi:tRNA-2-methylthio-N6-dimethylallyladenosine synthase
VATVNRLKDAVPDMAVSTDIIVGYPGETERDFTDTMSLLEEIEFDSAFSFKFSPRPGTPAAACPADETVDEETAGRRLSLLQSFQREVTLRKNQQRVGQIEEVLAEGPSKNEPELLTGRTTHNRITHFRGTRGLSGKMLKIRITEGLFNSLRGELSV